MRVALDTDVIVAALRSHTGASHVLLQELRLGHLEAVASVPMLLEYEEVLLREEHREAIGMTAEEIAAFLDPTLSRCKLRKNHLPSADYVAAGRGTLQERVADGNGPY